MAKPRFCQIPMTASTGSTVASSRSQLAVGKPIEANVLLTRPMVGCSSASQTIAMAASVAMKGRK